MKVSIVTPSYNQSRFLESTIRSVLGQEYKDLEYFIIDGGSTDGSVDIIRKYEDHLSGWVSEPDRGQAHAINKGFSKATGEVVAWLNSDDVYAPGAIKSAVDTMVQNPDIGLVYGNAVSIDQNGDPFHKQEFNDYELEDLVAFQIICQPAVFFRMDILEDVGFLDERYHYLLDHHLWLRIAQRKKIHHVPEIWAFARYHPGAKNITLSAEFGLEAYQLLEWMEDQPDLARIIVQNQEQVLAMVHRFAGRYFLDGGQGWKAFRSYLKSFRVSPRVALKEWHRILFAGMSVLGLRFLGDLYYRFRRRIFSSERNDIKIKNVDLFYRKTMF